MTWLKIALVLVVITFAVFAYALCRIAAQSDNRQEQ